MAPSLWKSDGYARFATLAPFAPIWHVGDAPRYNVPATVSVRAIHPPIRSASRAFLTTHNIGCATSSSATGVLVAAQSFDPWGAVRSGGVSSTEFNYTGQRTDVGTGLLFYNARYYDPALGRFLQADSIVPHTSHRSLTVDFHELGFRSETGERERAGFLVPVERSSAPTSYAAVGTRQPAGTQPLLLREQQSAEVQRSEWTQDDRSWTRYYL